MLTNLDAAKLVRRMVRTVDADAVIDVLENGRTVAIATRTHQPVVDMLDSLSILTRDAISIQHATDGIITVRCAFHSTESYKVETRLV